MAIPQYYTEITLDVSCEDTPIIVPTKQLDNLARILVISMYDSLTGEEVEIDSSLRVEFHVTRPDGVLIKQSNATIQSNKITVPLSENCLAVAGKALADIKLYSGQQIFSAASFALDVQQTATGKTSETRGILTRANLEIIKRSDFDELQSKELNTLYVVIGDTSGEMYLGEIPIGGSSSVVSAGTMVSLASGTYRSTQGRARINIS